MKRLAILNMVLAAVLAAFPFSANAKDVTTYHITDIVAYETFAKSRTGAVFLTIDQGEDKKTDKVTSATSPIASRVELHTHIHDNGIMRMREVPHFEFDQEGRIVLKPMGDHIMLMGMSGPLTAGDIFPLTLNFERHAPITINVHVVPFDPDVLIKKHHKNKQNGGHK